MIIDVALSIDRVTQTWKTGSTVAPIPTQVGVTRMRSKNIGLLQLLLPLLF